MKEDLDELRSTLADIGNHLDLESLKSELEDLQEEMGEPDFWDDQQKAKKKSKRADLLENRLEKYENLKEELEDAEVLLSLAEEESNQQEIEKLEEKLENISSRLQAFKLEVFMDGEFDQNDCYLEINAGAGGTDAQDWAKKLLRMYTMWLEKEEFDYRTLEASGGEVAGIKSATLEVNGQWAFGYLKCEQGVHRLVRISPFDSAGRRHTSFASVKTIPQFEDDLHVEIEEKDLRIDTYRASGAGGQHVNVTDSAVRITHEPSGIVVTCQNERSQHKNRETAMKMLKSRLFQLKREKRAEKISEIQGELKDIEWGSQIRSYILHPYKKVKDHRTDVEIGNTDAVLDGEIDPFIEAYLKNGEGN